MADPNDPDNEDRRPDRDREPEIFDDELDLEDERFEEEVVVSSRQLDLFDDDMIEYSYDDLKDMDGPDA
jgi:hypothetical protein